MKKTLLSLLFLSSIGLNAQTTIFEDSFETYEDFSIENVGNWTLVDVDGQPTYGIEQGTPPVSVEFANSGEPMAFIVMNSTASTPQLNAGWAGRTGSKCMAAMASIPDTSPTNDDWLISPRIRLGSSGNVLKFWAKQISNTYPERFKVGISTTGTDPLDFTFINPGTGVTPTNAWAEYTYNIGPAYQNQNVYLAIQCISEDAFALLIDDFKVTTTGLSTSDFFSSNFSVHPNPVSDIINISNLNNLEITSAIVTDVNGRVVKQVNSSVESINLSDLNSGVYFMRITTSEGEGVTKLLKQ